MTAIEVSAKVQLISVDVTNRLGFGTKAIEKMLGNVYTITRIENLGSNKMLLLDGMWVAQKDTKLYIDESLQSVNPPTLMFDTKNLF